MPAGWAAAAAAVVGGVMQADAAESAADSQKQSADRANELQTWMYQDTKARFEPFATGGRTGQANLNYLLGINPGGETISSGEIAGNMGLYKGQLLKPFGMDEFQASPAYQFNLDQGRKAIDKAANARGKYYAPATLQDIAKYSQGLASNEYQNAFSNYNTSMGNIYSRLQNLGGSGQNAAASLGGFGQNYAGAAGANMIGAGNAQAAGIVGQANAMGGIGSNLYNQYMTQQILGRNQAPTYGGGGGGGIGYGMTDATMSGDSGFQW